MRWFGGSVQRLVVVCSACALLVTPILVNSAHGPNPEEMAEEPSKIELIADVECGTGCTFILDPADQKAVAAGGIGAWVGIAGRVCGANLTCQAIAAAGAAIVTMYVSEFGSDTCDMHIRIRPTGVTAAVVVDHELVCSGEASPAG